MWVPLQDCTICMEKLSVASGYSDVTDSKTIGPMAVGCLAKCSHTFHLLCLLAMYCNGNKVPMAAQPGEGDRGHLPVPVVLQLSRRLGLPCEEPGARPETTLRCPQSWPCSGRGLGVAGDARLPCLWCNLARVDRGRGAERAKARGGFVPGLSPVQRPHATRTGQGASLSSPSETGFSVPF